MKNKHNKIWCFLFSSGLFLLLAVSCRSTDPITPVSQDLTGFDPNRLKLQIREEGLYSISRAELAQAGLDIDPFNISNVSLSQGGAAVPIEIVEENLVFWGQPENNRYQSNASYILEVGGPGLEIAHEKVPQIQAPILNFVPQTILLEENLVYTPEAIVTESDDVWFWHEIRQQNFFETSVNLPNISNNPALLKINAWGLTYNRDIENDHDLDLYLNEKFIATIQWDGQEFFTSPIEVPAGVLVPGTNKITLDNRPEGATFLDIMQVNWIELEYQALPVAINDSITFPASEGVTQIEGFSGSPMVLKLNDKNEPIRLDGWDYKNNIAVLPTNGNGKVAMVGPNGFLTPETIEPMRISHWRGADNQADLLIVAPELFAMALEPLVQAREDQSLATSVIPVEDIYDEFGYGVESPVAIQDFVTFAFTQWQEPRPRYLLLVGDATTDYLGYYGELADNLVPSLLVPVQFSGETVSDSRLADVDNDMKPDLAVGRWPVQSIEEVTSLVERTLAYEKGHAANRALFAADGSETRFKDIAAYIANAGKLPHDQIKILDAPSVEELTTELNEGSWLATYVGHGSLERWGKDDLFNRESVNLLKTETPPIVLQLTCLTGLFSHPSETSLSESMINDPDGPVLIIAATSLTLSAHQEPFGIELLANLQDPNIERIGDAFQKAKLSLNIETSKGLREVSDTFALLGDPSALIVRP